ncbi:MAG: aminotransferase class V-fold PLP-dependent enzyme [Lachnospiraceae bacterium]|nr:aminotransferase class V-fold PLP-dependent enzyme [Lachnospiraceae bacterium]
MSLADLLKEYGKSDYYPLHMPGHKRRLSGELPEEVVGMDITEIDGFDNLHQAEGILKEMQAYASRLYGADETFYLVNGSTCGILSAVSAAVSEGGHILMARNCHKSVYHACYLRKLKISYLYPQVMESYDICEPITCEQVQHALEQEKDIDAVLIVSPTYEGRITDVNSIARVVHEKGIPLIVDEAHGAHLGFWEGFEENSCRQGADLVIHSVHKTLPAMTQTALLHVNGSLIDRNQLKRFLHIYQSSSPSYVLMAGIENALRQVDEKGKDLFGNFIHNWNRMCRDLSTMKNLCILKPEKKQDIGKLLVSVKKTGLSGQQLYDMLLQEYHLQLEMATSTYVLAMFTVSDSVEGYERMTKALLEIDKKVTQEDVGRSDDVLGKEAWHRVEFTEKHESISFYKAWDMENEYCRLSLCQGRTAGEFINLYPPGIPMIVPGERIDQDLICQISDCLQKGLSVQGVRQVDGDIYLSVLSSQEICGR